MKKLAALFTCVIMLFTVASFVGCNNQSNAENGTVAIKYFNAASDMLPALKSGQYSIGLLPEPAATQLTKIANDKSWYKTDVQALYDGEKKAYPQAVIMVKESFLNTYPTAVEQLANGFADNVQWVKDNPQAAVNAVNLKIVTGVTPSLKAANITAEVVDGCKIFWQGAQDAKTDVITYINDIIAIEEMAANPVESDFFYNGQANGNFNANTVNVFAPDGAPALAIAKFINDEENFGTELTFNYTVVSSNDIGKKVGSGAGDIVIIPVNAATKLYNKTESYKMVGVITHGNLYIMSTAPFVTLAGKTMGVIGQGLVPDLTLRSILSKNKMGITIAV